MPDADRAQEEPQPVCSRCGCPAVHDPRRGGWAHAEVAAAVFCGLVMRPGRQPTQEG